MTDTTDTPTGPAATTRVGAPKDITAADEDSGSPPPPRLPVIRKGAEAVAATSTTPNGTATSASSLLPAVHKTPQPVPASIPASIPAPIPDPAAPEPRNAPQDTAPSAITARLEALEAVLGAAEGRLTPETVAAAQNAAELVRQRALLSPDHVVAVLAGATGSGKSSLFNALIQVDLSPVGAVRPTTFSALACVWDPDHTDGSRALLDRLGVDERRRRPRGSLLDGDAGRAEPDLSPLVLVDLPDHDSMVRTHRDETDRAVVGADLLLFVTDPQKYADADWHERYLSVLTHHHESLAVVFNKADTLAPDDARACVADLRRLLDERGLAAVPVLVTSARDGAGLAEVRDLLVANVRRKHAALVRSAADLDLVAARIAAELEPRPEREPRRDLDPAAEHRPDVPMDREAVCRHLADGTGAQALAGLVETSYRRRADAITGWPIRHGFNALRSWLQVGESDRYQPWTAPVAARPAAPPVQRSDVEAAVDGAVGSASRGLPTPWVRALRKAAETCVRDLTDTLDATLSGTEVGPRLIPRWWTAAQVFHWMLLTAALLGVSGMIADAFFGGMTLNLPDTSPIPFPVTMTLSALGAGIVLDGCCRVAARRAAKALRHRVALRMADRVRSAADQLLFVPLTAELDRYETARRHLRELQRTAPPTPAPVSN